MPQFETKRLIKLTKIYITDRNLPSQLFCPTKRVPYPQQSLPLDLYWLVPPVFINILTLSLQIPCDLCQWNS